MYVNYFYYETNKRLKINSYVMTNFYTIFEYNNEIGSAVFEWLQKISVHSSVESYYFISFIKIRF